MAGALGLLAAGSPAYAAVEGRHLFLYASRDDFAHLTLQRGAWDDARGGVTIAAGAAEATVTSPATSVPGLFDQLVVSWNALTPPGTRVLISVQIRVAEVWGRRFSVAVWHRDGSAPERTSVPRQEDGLARMDVDTLHLKRPGNAFRVTVRMLAEPARAVPALQLLAVQALNTHLPARPPGRPRATEAQAADLAVPEVSQLSVPDGHAWCSPTCVAMVMGYWSGVLGRPELRVGVREAAAGIRDRAYGGTGNWPFNTAYAAEFGGLVAYVDRFEDLGQLARWVGDGVPVVASIDRNILTRAGGKPMGHLVVVRGFTASGDVILNDPWAHLDRGETVRHTYPASDFAEAWLGERGSWGTVYLIYPRERNRRSG